MQIFMSTMRSFLSEQLAKQSEYFERINTKLDKQLEQSEQLREVVKAVHDRREQLVEQLSHKIEIATQ
jgi:flagellar hook-associated protein FlgK